MSREVHVRFCESGGVRFPSATHLVICGCGKGAEALGSIPTRGLRGEARDAQSPVVRASRGYETRS